MACDVRLWLQEALMKSFWVRRNEMQYRDSELRYDSESDELDLQFTRQKVDGRQYRRKRSVNATRSHSTKSPGTRPDCGIGARRNRRWSW
jgi:hypothetical protein